MQKKTVIAILLITLLASCSSPPGTWGWYVIDPTTKAGWNNITFLLSGFSATIQLSIIERYYQLLLG